MTYDSREDTLKHISRIKQLLTQAQVVLAHRANAHDVTKLEEPEKSLFDKFTPRLAKSTYGTDRYYKDLKGLKPALDHHYAKYRHHPEHFKHGIDDMNLLDLLEMLADWKAAGERHENGGDLRRSIKLNAERFGYGEKMIKRLLSTAEELGWL